MAIRFHYHRASTDLPHLRIVAGQLLCHVFSDVEDVVVARLELLAWRSETGFPGRLQRPQSRRQHLDVYFHWLELCGHEVDRFTLRRWLLWSRSSQDSCSMENPTP